MPTSSGDDIMLLMKSSPIVLKTRAKLTVLASVETNNIPQEHQTEMSAAGLAITMAITCTQHLKTFSSY